ncbi:YIP1 family protein [Paenibacillus sp. HJGM_3]|uniref:YIP1 family protein n=1 Tax=Paenibacillus sp. HJGM_3 TaxID=3379816 RepID=UPI00385B4117
MIRLLVKSAASCCALLLLFVSVPQTGSAATPYDTFYMGQKNGYQIQDVYVPAAVVLGQDLNTTPLKQPSDLFITGNDHVFVADTGNNRVLELDDRKRLVRTYGDREDKGKLNAPEGVFVTPEGAVFVADTGNKRVVQYTPQGEFVREFVRPQSDYLPQEYFFVPSKLIVDSRGVLYIANKGTYQGLLRMNGQGEFTGFFGANPAETTLLDRLKRMFFTKEQMSKESAIRPGEISNVALDAEGFIFTSNIGVNSKQVKRLNAGGVNRFKGDSKLPNLEQVVDVAVDRDAFFYALDRVTGGISICSPTGMELFRFGRISKNPQQAGVFAYPASIAVNSKSELWVLDNAMNMIQVFERTEFGDSVMRASAEYYKGAYVQSKPQWETVNKLNQMINLAYQGLGKAALQEHRVEEAMAHYKISYDAEGYSQAFWTYRLNWIRSNYAVALAALVGVYVLYRFALRPAYRLAAARTYPPRISQAASDLKDGWFLMFHPYEGFYRLKGRRLSWIALLVILLAAAAVRLLSMFGTGFAFNPVDLSKINVPLGLAVFFVPWFTWVIANYLVSTVKDGEGMLREVLQSSVYALIPYIVFTIPIVLLSNVLVLEEGILVQTLTWAMWLWMFTLFFVKTQVIHNFDFTENVKIILIALFTIAVLWIFIVVTFGLSYNLYDFFYQLYREVTLRA